MCLLVPHSKLLCASPEFATSLRQRAREHAELCCEACALVPALAINKSLFVEELVTALADTCLLCRCACVGGSHGGQVLCVLPKTCHNSFGGSQPVFANIEVQPSDLQKSLDWNWQVAPPTPP